MTLLRMEMEWKAAKGSFCLSEEGPQYQKRMESKEGVPRGGQQGGGGRVFGSFRTSTYTVSVEQ